MHIYASLEEAEYNEEEYQCPLFVHSNLPSYSTFTAAFATNSSNNNIVEKSDISSFLLVHIPMATTEDTEDCKMYNISLCSGPKWSNTG